MYCIKCGTYIDDKYRYCPKCGALKYKKEEPLAKTVTKVVYYFLIVEVAISLAAYLFSIIILAYNGSSTIEIIAAAIEMVFANAFPIVGIILLKNLKDKNN